MDDKTKQFLVAQKDKIPIKHDPGCIERVTQNLYAKLDDSNGVVTEQQHFHRQ